MKKTLLILMVAFAMTAMVACGEKDNTPAGGNGGGNNGGGNNGGNDVPAGWVDLGLPSGLLWAECNVGANAPEGAGDYFAWGETAPKNDYSWSTYRYGSMLDALTKYCSVATYGLDGYTDSLTVLEPGDDAAAVRLGGGARMPTREEWGELKEYTTCVWTERNGVNGRLFTAANGRSLFLPAASSMFNTELEADSTWGHYWSSSLAVDAPFYAGSFHFTDELCDVSSDSRIAGFNVRAVRARQR